VRPLTEVSPKNPASQFYNEEDLSLTVASNLNAESNLLNAMSFHRQAATQNRPDASRVEVLHFQDVANDSLEENKQAIDDESYQEPVQTDSELFRLVDERIRAGQELLKEEDLLDDGEQKYETEGEDSPLEPLSDRLHAMQIGGARTNRVE